MSIDAKYMISVMQKFVDGKEIECSPRGQNNWICTVDAAWDWSDYDYQVKSEVKYVPYDSIEEVDKDKWVKHKVNGILCRIDEVDTNDNTVHPCHGWVSLLKLFEVYTYEDGTPCGKKVE